MDNPVTFSDITLLNTLATCANMTTDEVFKDFKIMANKKIGKQTVKLSSPVTISSTYSVVGVKEGEGPLAKYFDIILEDEYWDYDDLIPLEYDTIIEWQEE